MMRTLFHLVLSLTVVASAAEATILRVPSEYATIQAGIDASVDGDTVLVSPGTYSGDGNTNLRMTTSITLQGEEGARKCIIDCQDSEGVYRGGIGVSNPYGWHGVDRAIIGFSIVNAYGRDGAIGCGSGCFLTIQDCIITNNTTQGNSVRSAGICVASYDSSTNVLVRNCLITANQCLGERSIGGGVFCGGVDTHVVLRNCVIAGNRATFGGGVACKEGTVRLENCIVTNNKALTGKGNQLYVGNARAGCPITGCEVGFIELVYSCFDEEIPVIYWHYEGNWGSRGWVVDFHGQGNVAGDPLFVTPGYWDPKETENDPNDDFWVDGDYHLLSQAGRWDPDSDAWIQDDATSPCIDAGDPNSPIMHEPFPNGGIINMGAYGGTAEASKSYFGQLLCETIIAGDINGDCSVNIDDLLLLMSHWLEAGNLTPEAGDGGDEGGFSTRK